MGFLEEYPVFSAGYFFDREGHIKARVDNNKQLIYKIYDGKIAGRIKNHNLYDEGLNRVGYFKDNVLYTVGGSVMGYCRTWKLENTDSKKEDDSIWTVIVFAGTAGLFIILMLRIFEMFLC